MTQGFNNFLSFNAYGRETSNKSSAQSFLLWNKTPDIPLSSELAVDGCRPFNFDNCLKNKRLFFKQFVNLLEKFGFFLDLIV